MTPRYPLGKLPASALISLVLMLFEMTAQAADRTPLADTYRARAEKLIAAALDNQEGYENLTHLCDRIGHRLSGSESLERAIAWSAELMRRRGLSNVETPSVMVPKWVRGAESAAIVSPLAKPMRMLGLGMSVGTPPGGITADVVVVSSIEQLKQLERSAVEGRIVVFNAPYESYERTVRVRVLGPQQAAAMGAVAALVRSITPLAAQLPHTGTTASDEKLPRIPAAAITPEDAKLLARLTTDGATARVKLEMQARREPDARSANVIGEIVGSSHPDEVVVLGGHIDSWDVGQGAHDDGAALMATLEAAALIKQLELKPRRTIRVVFWTNEENGTAGAKAYRASIGERIDKHVAAIEMDGGAEAPLGFGYGHSGARRPAGAASTPVEILPAEQRSFEMLRDIATLLKPLGADTIRPGGFGADIDPLMKDGVPALGHLTTMARYFDWHHTEADTLDKVDPVEFRKNIAVLAVMAYVLADMPERLVGLKTSK